MLAIGETEAAFLVIVTVTNVLVALLQPVIIFLASAQAVYTPTFVPDGALVVIPPVAEVYQSIVSPIPTLAEPTCCKPS